MQTNAPIVIIEDDPDDQYFFKIVCESLGVCEQLEFFAQANSALEYLKTTTKQPFVILCDINLPGMSGVELRKIINNTDYLRRKSIPFVFFSTAATEDQIQEAYDMTVQGFFLKQQNLKETQDVLDTIFKYWRKCIHPNAK